MLAVSARSWETTILVIPNASFEQADQAHQNTHGDRILADEGFVVHENLRIQGNRTRQGDTTFHATGQLIRHQLDGATQTNGLQFHQYDVANHLFRKRGMHAQGERRRSRTHPGR